MKIAEKIQEKNREFGSLENIVTEILSDVDNGTQIFPDSVSGSTTVGITRD